MRTPRATALLLPSVLLAAMLGSVWAADLVVVEDWAKLSPGARGIPDGWKGGQSWGTPKHDMTIVENEGHRVLRLKSVNESSTINKEIKGQVNLKETPILEWSWKVVALPKGADSRSKATDDQAVQLYVIWPRFPQAIRSRIIGYVWDTTAPAGLFVKSEKTGTVTYVVVRSGAAEAGRWLTERRNVVEDYKKIFGEEPENPGAVSVAIDSDDTSSSAESFLGPIVFKRQ
ncbi:MAG: DUF3047 domain-containing protein [Candidatus Rokubacteria bacterium]|nr:DUF3047 domain-containing protein [Candidatus Rokubacteria bacterium]